MDPRPRGHHPLLTRASSRCLPTEDTLTMDNMALGQLMDHRLVDTQICMGGRTMFLRAILDTLEGSSIQVAGAIPAHRLSSPLSNQESCQRVVKEHLRRLHLVLQGPRPLRDIQEHLQLSHIQDPANTLRDHSSIRR